VVLDPPVEGIAGPERRILPGAAPATERRRPLFHPRRGWLRRLERAGSLFLSRVVYPRVPGIGLPYGRQLRRQLTLSEASIDLAGLPSSFDGVRLLLISDLHAGPFVSPAELLRATDRLAALRTDLILVVGDLITSRVTEIETHRAALARLEAPLGVFAVLGNHDHYSGQPEQVIERVRGLGIEVLHNRSVALERDGARLSLAGVDDALVGSPDLDAALRNCRPPVVLLSHNPDLVFEAARRQVALMLAGHTHGGQIRLPGLPVLVRQSRYRLDHGRYRAGSTELVVSRGIGAVGLPLRLFCAPEAVLLTLRRSRA